MIAPRRIVDVIDNRMNPVTVKELRQAVRSGLVTGGFLLFVMALLLTMGGALLSQGSVTVDFRGGPEIFGYLVIILTVAATFLLPMYAGARLAGERTDPHAGLLFVTSLSTWRLVWGKTLASVILAVIVYSACAPFITFTYLLRGIDFPTIVLVLVTSFLFSTTVIQFAIFIGALPIGKFVRIILALVSLYLAWSFISWFIFGVMGYYGLFVLAGLRGGSGIQEAWPVLLTLLALDMLLIGLFYVLTVTLLLPPAANRTLVLRLYLMFAWLGMGVIALLWAIEAQHAAPMYMWGTAWWTFLIVCMLAVICERDSWGPRIRRRIPRDGVLRAGAFALYTGAAGGMTWIVLMIGITAAVMEMTRSAWSGRWDSDFRDTMQILFGMTLFCYAYCMTAVLLRQWTFKRLSAKNTWFLVLLLLCVLYVLPMFLAYILLPLTSRQMYRLNTEIGWWNATNPFMLFERDCRDVSLAIAVTWAFLAAICSAPWYFKQMQLFRPWREVADEPIPIVEPLDKPSEDPDVVDNDGSETN